MPRLDQNNMYIKNKQKVMCKLTAILGATTISLSIVFINIYEGENKFVSFSNNMFFTGTMLLTLSIIINFIKNIFIFKNRKYFAGKNIKTKGIDEQTLAALDNKERKFFLKYELFAIVSRSFVIAGVINFVISAIIVLLV